MDNKESLSKPTNNPSQNSTIKNIEKSIEGTTRRSYQKLLKQNTISLLLDQSIREKIISWLQVTTNNGKHEFEILSLVNYVLSITNLSINHTSYVISIIEEISKKHNYSHLIKYDNVQPTNSDDVSMKNSQTSNKSLSFKNDNQIKHEMSESKNRQKSIDEDEEQAFYHLRRVIVKLLRKTSKYPHTSSVEIKNKIENFHKFVIEQMKLNLNRSKTYGQQDISSIQIIEQRAKEYYPEFYEILSKSLRVGHNIWRRQLCGTGSKRQIFDASENDIDSDSLMSNENKSTSFVDTPVNLFSKNSEADNQIKTRSSLKSHEPNNLNSSYKNCGNKEQTSSKNIEYMETSLTYSTNNSQNNQNFIDGNQANYFHSQNNHISECETAALIKLMDSYRKTAQSLLLTASYLEEQFKNTHK